MSNYDKWLESPYQKFYAEGDKFTAWMEEHEEELLLEYAKSNPDFDPKDRVSYGKFVDYCNDVYDRQSL